MRILSELLGRSFFLLSSYCGVRSCTYSHIAELAFVLQISKRLYFMKCAANLVGISSAKLIKYTGWLKKSKLLTQYNSLLFLSHPVGYSCV